MTDMNIIAIVTFIIGVPGIGWMIWNQEKVIRFEQRMKNRFLKAANAALLYSLHKQRTVHKGVRRANRDNV